MIVLRAKVGSPIEILNVIVPLVNYHDATLDRINALNVEKANTGVAEQRAKTVEAEARARDLGRIGVDSPSCWPACARMPHGRPASARWDAAEHLGDADRDRQVAESTGEASPKIAGQ